MEIKENKYVIFDRPKNVNLRYLIRCLGVKLLGLYYKIYCGFLDVTRKDDIKKNKVAICAIFKNEAKYLKEWIEYHRIVGVDKFYLYNNNSDDNYETVLDPYIKKGIVELKLWEKNQAQMEAYADCVELHKNDVKWLGFIDIDEFVVPIENDSIYDYLKKYDANRGSILIYWQFFGTSGKIIREEDSLVTDTFHSCWRKHDAVGKCFYNTSFILDSKDKKNACFHHVLWTKNKKKKIPPFNVYNKPVICDFHFGKKHNVPIQINHYFTKTYDEYLLKKSKGDVYFKINPHDEEYFYKHEMKCGARDYSIEKYMIKLKLAMDKFCE